MLSNLYFTSRIGDGAGGGMNRKVIAEEGCLEKLPGSSPVKWTTQGRLEKPPGRWHDVGCVEGMRT